MSQKYKTVGVSFPKNDLPLLDAAKAKAKSRRWSFSNYVCSLIEADLQSQALELKETSSSKILEAADRNSDQSNYKIRRPRKPLPEL